MRLELAIENDKRALPSAEAFLRAALAGYPLLAAESESLCQLVLDAARHAVESAFPPGETGPIRLTVEESGGRLEMLVRDFGLPQDIAVLEGRLHASGGAPGWHSPRGTEAADELHWLGFGPEGKALEVVKWLPGASPVGQISAAAKPQPAAQAPLAPPQHYDVRRLRPDEATQVSQLMYLTYGGTYFNTDVYYPDRIAAQNQRQQLISVVAVGEDGRVAAHCALERNQDGLVAEIGQAAVDPAHRGRGLLDRMKAVLEEEARALGLAGWYADAVTVHTFTQQSDAHHGGHVCGVDLAISPATESFRGFADVQPQRVSCVVYFHWLAAAGGRSVFAPDRHREMIAAIYRNIGAPVEFGRPREAERAHGTLAVCYEAAAARATIRAEKLGRDSVQAIRHAVRERVERSRAEVVFVELPLTDPAAATVCEELEAAGLAFSGIGPHFSPRGDVLKLAYVVTPLAREPIKTFEPFAGQLVEYVLAEQARVRAGL